MSPFPYPHGPGMTKTRQRERSHLFHNAASQNRVQARETVSDHPVCALTHTHTPNPVARKTAEESIQELGKPRRGRRETKFANRQSIHSLQTYLLLAELQASPSRTVPPGFHGRGGVGVATPWPPQCGSHTGDAGLTLPLFLPRPGSGQGLLPPPPGPPNGEDRSGSWKKRMRGDWAGVSGLAFLRTTVPREARAFPLSPQLGKVSTAELASENACHGNSSSQLDQTRARQLSPAAREEQGAERARGGGRGLARGQTATPLLRWPHRDLGLLPGSS